MQNSVKLKAGIGLAVGALVIATAAVMVAGPKPGADPADAAQVAQGQAVYAEHCASCHGARLEGQPEWQSRKPDGRLPAPPHDASGHTWHHPDEDLFKITKQGVTAFAPPGYASDMPAFGGVLSDADIWAVLAYIKSTWPEDTRRRHAAMSERARK
ncbi:c-type cytochrome [Azospirillum soli]|uniref:c-type cytochrome n=1 Tax=Azospirillum soli TaxID=1304799 RepID=UPI0031B84031|nr:mono/diheme cytochrome c family protein [Azospirillum soli]